MGDLGFIVCFGCFVVGMWWICWWFVYLLLSLVSGGLVWLIVALLFSGFNILVFRLWLFCVADLFVAGGLAWWVVVCCLLLVCFNACTLMFGWCWCAFGVFFGLVLFGLVGLCWVFVFLIRWLVCGI